jgi:hypothetical protein
MTETWMQIGSLFLANAALILWFRSESRADWRMVDAKIDAMQAEMKDFHIKLALQDLEFKAMLCKIEENKKR